MTSTQELEASEAVAGRHGRFHINEFSWIWFALVGIFVLSWIFAPGSVTGSAVVNMLPFASILAIAAVGQTLVIQQRGLDLAVGGVITLSGIVMCELLTKEYPAVVVIVIALATGAAAGAFSGLLIARFSITPLVATLAVNALLLGLVRAVSGGFPVSASSGLTEFSRGKTLGIPNTMLIAIVFVIIVSLVLRKTVVGRRFTAVGANAETARAAGIRVSRYQIGTYAAAGLCFAMAGVLLAGFIGTATAQLGLQYLLPSITAVVVGGTPFSGGRGSVLATAVAALFLTQLDQLVLSLGANSAVQLLIQAIVLVLATSIRRIPFGKLRRAPQGGHSSPPPSAGKPIEYVHG